MGKTSKHGIEPLHPLANGEEVAAGFEKTFYRFQAPFSSFLFA
jgi:hypothetical protein